MKLMVSSALTLLLVLLGVAPQQAAIQADTHHPEISSSLIVNQLAILNMLEQNSNSCSSINCELLRTPLEALQLAEAPGLQHMEALQLAEAPGLQHLAYPIIMERLEAQGQEVKLDLDNLMTDVLAQISAIKNETYSGFENTKDEFKSLLEVYEQSLIAYKTEVDTIASSFNETREDLKIGLEVKLNEQQELQTLQQQEITRSKSEVTSITAQVSSLKINVDSISRKVDSFSTQVNSLSTQVGALNTQVNSLNTKVNSFTTKVNSISTKVDSLSTQIANLETKINLNSLLSQHTVYHTTTMTCSGNQVLTSNSGAITVVNSGNYGDNVECSWKITLPAGKRILLKWSHFELEYNSGCAYDYVMIQDLNRSSQLVYGSKLCGPIAPDNILVESNNLNIFFHSDRSNTFRGFGLVYQGI